MDAVIVVDDPTDYYNSTALANWFNVWRKEADKKARGYCDLLLKTRPVTTIGEPAEIAVSLSTHPGPTTLTVPIIGAYCPVSDKFHPSRTHLAMVLKPKQLHYYCYICHESRTDNVLLQEQLKEGYAQIFKKDRVGTVKDKPNPRLVVYDHLKAYIDHMKLKLHEGSIMQPILTKDGFETGAYVKYNAHTGSKHAGEPHYFIVDATSASHFNEIHRVRVGTAGNIEKKMESELLFDRNLLPELKMTPMTYAYENCIVTARERDEKTNRWILGVYDHETEHGLTAVKYFNKKVNIDALNRLSKALAAGYHVAKEPPTELEDYFRTKTWDKVLRDQGHEGRFVREYKAVKGTRYDRQAKEGRWNTRIHLVIWGVSNTAKTDCHGTVTKIMCPDGRVGNYQNDMGTQFAYENLIGCWAWTAGDISTKMKADVKLFSMLVDGRSHITIPKKSVSSASGSVGDYPDGFPAPGETLCNDPNSWSIHDDHGDLFTRLIYLHHPNEIDRSKYDGNLVENMWEEAANISIQCMFYDNALLNEHEAKPNLKLIELLSDAWMQQQKAADAHIPEDSFEQFLSSDWLFVDPEIELGDGYDEQGNRNKRNFDDPINYTLMDPDVRHPEAVTPMYKMPCSIFNAVYTDFCLKHKLTKNKVKFNVNDEKIKDALKRHGLEIRQLKRHYLWENGQNLQYGPCNWVIGVDLSDAQKQGNWMKPPIVAGTGAGAGAAKKATASPKKKTQPPLPKGQRTLIPVPVDEDGMEIN
jgi:hypothetical protein